MSSSVKTTTKEIKKMKPRAKPVESEVVVSPPKTAKKVVKKKKKMVVTPPKGTPTLNTQKKKNVAIPLDECEGMRTGSFERLLRFCNHLLFGPENCVRVQDDVKRKIQEGVEDRLGLIIKNAMLRRSENKGKTLQASNVLGAFKDWATLIKPEAVLRYLDLYEITSLFTTEMLIEEHEERAELVKLRKEAFASTHEDLIKANLEGLKNDKNYEIEYDSGMDGNDKIRLRKLLNSLLKMS